MKITSIKAHVMGIPCTGGKSPARNWIFVQVETDEGIEGVGEATTEYHELAVVAMIEQHFAPLLVGQDPTRITHAWQQMQRCFWWRGGVVATSAASGIEQALWDIAGKACGQPVCNLLGGAVRDSVKLYARSDLGLASQAEEAVVAAQEGFTAFKYGPRAQFGEEPFDEQRTVDNTLRIGQQVRESAGPDCDLMIDCGGIFSKQAAARLIDGLREPGMLFVEEPVNMDVPRGLVELRQAFPDVRIAGGERQLTRWQFRDWLEKGAVDVIQADVCHCGGIGELLRIASSAEGYNVQVAPHNPYGPVALAAAMHAGLCMPNFLILEHCRHRPWFEDVQHFGPTIADGQATPNGRPGLGIELDWEVIGKQPYQRLPLWEFTQQDGGLPLL